MKTASNRVSAFLAAGLAASLAGCAGQPLRSNWASSSRQLLPPDLHSHIDRLTHRQLVALRFASDAEMAELVREVAGGQLSTAKDIKMRIKNWQGDWLRA